MRFLIICKADAFTEGEDLPTPVLFKAMGNFNHTLFGVYLGVLARGRLWFRDERVRRLLPLRT